MYGAAFVAEHLIIHLAGKPGMNDLPAQVTGRDPYSADWYVVTDEMPDFSDTQGLQSSAGIFRPTFNDQPVRPRCIKEATVLQWL